ncbi:PAAR domain-containing protein, partial [Salmonella enterica]|uniref:PAAR domain-containing protein n=1 Tax=Salmonella enterica TaxID=28901 RepID=UPI0015913C85
MPTAARLNDKGTQHDDYYETVSIASSPTVFIDGLPVARMGDAVDCGGEVNMTRMKSGKALMNPLMILVKIIKLRWIHILSYDQMVSRKI